MYAHRPHARQTYRTTAGEKETLFHRANPSIITSGSMSAPLRSATAPTPDPRQGAHMRPRGDETTRVNRAHAPRDPAPAPAPPAATDIVPARSYAYTGPQLRPVRAELIGERFAPELYCCRQRASAGRSIALSSHGGRRLKFGRRRPPAGDRRSIPVAATRLVG